MKNVIALVLAGGKIGNYGVLTQNRAKGALTFAANYRVIDFALSSLRHSHIEQIGIIIQYLPASLIEHVGVGQPWDLHLYGRALKIMPPFIGIEKTSWYRGTADAIHQNMNFVIAHKAEHVVVLSGEHVYRLDFAAVLHQHKDLGSDITIVTKELPPEKCCSNFGYVVAGNDGRVREYREKPRTAPSNHVSTGIYVFKKQVLSDLLAASAGSEERNLARDIIEPNAAALNCHEYRMTDSWEYMENVREYYDAQFRLLGNGNFETLRSWGILTNLEFRGAGFGAPALFGDNSEFTQSYAGANCRIGGRVERSILSPGVKVAKGAIVRDSILLHDCVIEEGATLDRVVSDRDAIFESHCTVGEQTSDSSTLTLIGKAARVTANSTVAAGAQISTANPLPG